MMTVSPAAFIATDQPDQSFAVSPSISAPTCTHPLVSQREHPSLTRTIAVAVVAVCADDDRVTSSIHRHRIAGIIVCGFAVDIGTDLHPPTVSQREHPSLTRIIAVVALTRAPMMTVSPAAFIATD